MVVTPARLAGILGAPPVPQGSWEREAAYTSAVALTGASGGAPREIAEQIAVRLRGLDGVASVTVRPNGFLLIVVTVPGEIVREIVASGAETMSAEAIPTEALSVRMPPTGTLPVGVVPVELPWPDFPRTWENPGFVIRYAYTRAVAVQRWARDLGVPAEGFRPELLTDRHDRAVLRLLAELPSRTASRDPRWVTYLRQLATAYHDAHEHAPAIPIGDQPVSELHTARLRLAEAVRIVMRSLVGATLPARL